MAERVRNAASREERAAVYATMYDELFERVPDHPRLVRRETPEMQTRAVEARMRLLRPFLTPDMVFLEFAPGDCRLAFEVAKGVRKVYGVDISDQTGPAADVPPNFELIVFDGFALGLPAESVDLAFSYQLLEHIRPDDVVLHFESVARLLRPGGRYVFSTPHAFSGPHDVSRFFSDEPLGFHLKEWTYAEIGSLVRRTGFSSWHTFRFGRPRPSRLVKALTLLCESALRPLPRGWQRRLSRRPFGAVTAVAVKGA